MIVLDTSTKTLELVLGAAHTTNALEYNIVFYDVPRIAIVDNAEYIRGHSHGQSNGTTTVTILTAPPDSVSRNVELLSVYNKDTIEQSVTLKYDIAATERILLKAPLRPGETLTFTRGGGWQIL